MNRMVSKIAVCLALVIFAVFSFGPAASTLSDPERYTAYTASLDDKTETVLKLMAASTVTSAGLSAIPGDTATPIAEKLADFSEYFLLILCVLYAEKYLLCIIPLGVLKALVPLSCALFVAGRFWNPRFMDRHGLKLFLASLALLCVIPLSIQTSDLIYATYQQSIDSALSSAEELSDETAALAESEETNVLSSLLNKLTDTRESLTEQASAVLNRFVESLAVMIVTSCVIPILVLLFFVWLVRQFTGIDFRDLRDFRPRPRGDDQSASS